MVGRLGAIAASFFVLSTLCSAATAAGSLPCSIHGRWELVSSEYRDASLTTNCDLREKSWTAGPGSLLVSGYSCPTPAQKGQSGASAQMTVTYKVIDIPSPPSRVAHGVADEGCACVYMSTSDDPGFNTQLNQAKAFLGTTFASLCVRYQRRDNTIIAKSDLFKLAGLSLTPATCPNSTEWQAGDVGKQRYRDVMVAVGPLHRTSNQSVAYSGLTQAEVTAEAGVPLSSLALAPACMPFNEPPTNRSGGVQTGSNAEECVEVHRELQYAALGAAIVSILLITSWFGCCVWVWHAKQQPASPRAAHAKTTVAMVLVSMFIHVFSVALILPSLTPLVVDQIFDGSTSEASVFLTTTHVIASCLEFCSNPVVGGVSDERGRKSFLFWSLIATVVSFFIIGAIPSRATIAISGAMRGLTAVTVTMGNAMIVDVSKLGRHDGGDGSGKGQDVTINLGFLLAVAALGLMCGPIIGGIVGLFSLQAPFLLAAAFEVLNAVFVRAFVPETLERPTPFSWSAANPVALVRMLCSTPALRASTLVLVFVNLAFGVYSQAALWTQLRFEWQAVHLGALLTFIGLLAAVTIGVVSKCLIPAWGEVKVVVVSVGFGIAQMVLMGLATQGWMWYLTLLVTSMAFVAPTALRGVITKQAPREMQGKIQGCVGSLNTATGAFGPAIASALFVVGTSGSEALRYQLDLGAALCFFGAAGLLVVAAALSYCLRGAPNASGEDPDPSRFVALHDMSAGGGAGPGVAGSDGPSGRAPVPIDDSAVRPMADATGPFSIGDDDSSGDEGPTVGGGAAGGGGESRGAEDESAAVAAAASGVGVSAGVPAGGTIELVAATSSGPASGADEAGTVPALTPARSAEAGVRDATPVELGTSSGGAAVSPAVLPMGPGPAGGLGGLAGEPGV